MHSLAGLLMRTVTRSRSLRTKILAWSLVPTVLALGAIALVSYFAYQAMAHDLVLDRDRELTRLLAEQLGSQLTDYAGTPANLSRAEEIYEQEMISEQTLFRRLVNSIRPRTGEEGIAYLVNAEGAVILHSDRSRVGESLMGMPAVEAALAGETGALRIHDDSGREILTSYAPVPGTTWGLVIEQPWSSLTASISAYQRAILVLMAGGLVLVGALVMLGVRRTTGPLRELVTASRAISEGDFQTRVTAATGDEIETLAVQFNRMSARLQESYHALARRASRRERELSTLNEVTAASSLARELPDVFQESLLSLDRALGFGAAAIWTVDTGIEKSTFAAGHGDSEAIQSLVTSPDTDRLRAELLGPAVQSDAGGPTRAADSPVIVERAEGGTLVGVPVVARGRRLGMLAVILRAEEVPDSEQVQLLTTVGQQLGLAIESHRLFADTSRQRGPLPPDRRRRGPHHLDPLAARTDACSRRVDPSAPRIRTRLHRAGGGWARGDEGRRRRRLGAPLPSASQLHRRRARSDRLGSLLRRVVAGAGRPRRSPLHPSGQLRRHLLRTRRPPAHRHHRVGRPRRPERVPATLHRDRPHCPRVARGSGRHRH